MMTTKQNIYVAGDASGIEEGGIAEDEGRLAGLDIAFREDPGQESVVLDRKIVQSRLWENRSGPCTREKCTAKKEIIANWYTRSGSVSSDGVFGVL